MAKRANGEGSIRKRVTKNGSIYWEGRYSDPVTKKQRSITAKTKEEVRKQLTQKAMEKDTGKFVSKSDITFDTWYRSYVKLYKEGVVKVQTVHLLNTLYNNAIKPYLGDMRLQEITDLDVKNMLDELSTHYATSSLQRIRTHASSIFKRAVEKRLITNNPMDYIPDVAGGETTPKRELTDYEMYWFFTALSETSPKDVLFFQLLFATGARIGEIIGLKWCDFADDFSYIDISRTNVRRKENGEWINITNAPKTKTSQRLIPVISGLRPSLREWKERGKFIAKQFNKKFSDEYFVFYDRKKDRTYTDDHFSYVINRALKYLRTEYNIEIKHFSPHYFRHTFTSKAVRCNISMELLKNLLGHSSYAMISKVYAHTTKEDKMNALMTMFPENN